MSGRSKPRTLRFVLGDQLTRTVSSLADAEPGRDVILMVEALEEATYVAHHKQKIAFLFSAMRHFAAELEAEGFTVRYVRLDEAGNSGSFTGELMRAVAALKPARVIVTEPGEHRVLEMMRAWEATLNPPVEIRADDRFYCSIDDFKAWAKGRRRFLMEHFYRVMRRTHDVLMEDGQPLTGRWNYDAENRKRLPKGFTPPPRARFKPDAVTRAVIDLVASRFGGHFGDLEGFGWAVTRADARTALKDFLTHALPRFGDHQDAMQAGAPFLFHAVLSPYLNAGLLTAREVVEAAVGALDTAPINAVEGFVRQILGWREYVRGLYWLRMPAYKSTNSLDAHAPLPAFYWGGDTAMACVADVVATTRAHAYAHHIQRLMITGNLALLWGVEPGAIEEWYLIVYADAYEWVELPNVHGMAVYADGGLLASKPYAAGGGYINRMSDYCRGCAYDPGRRIGEGACPFTTLYWDFLARHRERLRANTRLSLAYKALDAIPARERAAIAARARAMIEAGTDLIDEAGPARDLFATAREPD